MGGGSAAAIAHELQPIRVRLPSGRPYERVMAEITDKSGHKGTLASFYISPDNVTVANFAEMLMEIIEVTIFLQAPPIICFDGNVGQIEYDAKTSLFSFHGSDGKKEANIKNMLNLLCESLDIADCGAVYSSKKNKLDHILAAKHMVKSVWEEEIICTKGDRKHHAPICAQVYLAEPSNKFVSTRRLKFLKEQF